MPHGTVSFPAVLRDTGCAVIASTYQANRLILIRARGEAVNVHYREVNRPMGLAVDSDRLAVGTYAGVAEYRNVGDVAGSDGGHDAVYVLRRTFVTGDIAIHDVAYVAGALWLTATRFSCLATLDGVHSFVPQWMPPFVTEFAGEDRCHLNGFAAVGAAPRYVSAFAASDTAGGWRAVRRDGGLVIDVRTGDVIAEGLFMPHSPRWHRDRLWVLESGRGRLLTLDPGSGEMSLVAVLPGFARGLAFAGRYAFVGLSRPRDGATFTDLPVFTSSQPPMCGVWVVDLVTGDHIASLRLPDEIEEIYDVAVTPGAINPEIPDPESALTRNTIALPAHAAYPSATFVA